MENSGTVAAQRDAPDTPTNEFRRPHHACVILVILGSLFLPANLIYEVCNIAPDAIDMRYVDLDGWALVVWWIHASLILLSFSNFLGLAVGVLLLIRTRTRRLCHSLCTAMFLFNCVIVIVGLIATANGLGPYRAEWDYLNLPYRPSVTPDFIEKGPWRRHADGP